MNKPNLYYEKNIFQNGYDNIIALDEAGRGAIAGPLVVAAINLDKNYPQSNPIFNSEINDSKKIKPDKRKILYQYIIQNFQYYIQQEQILTIENINIHNATLKAMKEAILKLEENIQRKSNRKKKVLPLSMENLLQMPISLHSASSRVTKNQSLSPQLP